jgi:hypothetical protein
MFILFLTKDEESNENVKLERKRSKKIKAKIRISTSDYTYPYPNNWAGGDRFGKHIAKALELIESLSKSTAVKLICPLDQELERIIRIIEQPRVFVRF